MADLIDENESRQKIFILSSDVDRRRVEGLVILLEKMGGNVSFVTQSIRRQRVFQTTVKENLVESKALIIFWAKNLARSKCVSQVYELFKEKCPDGPIWVVVGDDTALPEFLEDHSAPGLFPQLEHLLSLVDRHKREGTRNYRSIREILEQQLSKINIALTSQQRKLVLILFDLLPFFGYPRHFVDQLGGYSLGGKPQLSMTHLLLAGGGVIVGVLLCKTGAVFQDDSSIQDDSNIPVIEQVTVRANQNGHDACKAVGLICVSVSQTEVLVKEKFYGHSTPTCSARIAKRSGCLEDYNTPYAYTNVHIVKSPNADPSIKETLTNFFCIKSSDDGSYNYANCTNPN